MKNITFLNSQNIFSYEHFKLINNVPGKKHVLPQKL